VSKSCERYLIWRKNKTFIGKKKCFGSYKNPPNIEGRKLVNFETVEVQICWTIGGWYSIWWVRTSVKWLLEIGKDKKKLAIFIRVVLKIHNYGSPKSNDQYWYITMVLKILEESNK
jgi:hypothetical protein